MSYIKKNRKNDDLIYLYCLSTYPFNYYSKRYGFSDDDYIEGKLGIYDRNEYLDDIQELRGNDRIWLVFSHSSHHQDGVDDENFFLFQLDCMGKRLDRFKSIGATVYLYDLRNT